MPSYTPNYNWAMPNVNDPVDADLWGGMLNGNLYDQDTLIKSLANQIAAIVTEVTGAIKLYGAASAPAGYLVCDGQNYSTATYAALFAVIGYTFGGAGASFNVPDLRGRVAAGVPTGSSRITTATVNNTALGGVGGLETHTLAVTEMPSHNHTFTSLQLGNSPSLGGGAGQLSGSGGGTTANTGGGLAHNNLQPTILLYYIIKT